MGRLLKGGVGVLSCWGDGRIRPHLPALARLPRTWTLLYSLDQHGISINTLYTRCEAHLSNPKIVSKGALVVIQDSGVKLSRGAYYGGGESFLWRADKDRDKGRAGKGVKVWKWTGRNDYVALCEGDYLSFGGGDGHYGLYLDSSLFDGSSAPCPTFANEPLCTPGPLKACTVEFECVGLEVWGLAP
ncbi:TLDc domain-containing protein [Cyathus striatus]|nr:TLDc domain-containing protein [Cyathus striatus]